MQRSPCLRCWVVHLSHSLLLIKRILLPTLCWVSFMYHVWWIFFITLYIVHLTCHIYIYKIVLGEFSLCRWRRCIPENFGEKQSGRRQSLDQSSIIGWVQNLFLFPFYTLLKLIVCKFRSKLVTPDPRLQGCLILNNRKTIWCPNP